MTPSRQKIFFALFIVFFGLLFASHSASAATIYANSTTGNDTTGTGSSGSPYLTFHKAYTVASANDTINLTGTFNWADAGETGDATTSGYTISKNLTITGQSATSTIVQAASSDNTANRRVFTIANGVTATISNLTIRYGKITSGYGGGIDVIGTATIDACDISYNRSEGGGGVNVWGTATVSNSAIHNNIVVYMGGGLNRYYYTNGNGTPGASDTLDVINSTIYSNTVTSSVAYLEGGGVFYRRGYGSITNSTITLNEVSGSSQASTNGLGRGDGTGTTAIKNSIIAGNIFSTYGGDIGSRESSGDGSYIDNGGNIIGRPGYYPNGFSPSATTWMNATTYSGSIDSTFVKQ